MTAPIALMYLAIGIAAVLAVLAGIAFVLVDRSDVSQWPQSTLTAIDTVAETVSLTPLGQFWMGLV